MSDVPKSLELTELSQLRRHLDRMRSAGDLSAEVLVQDLETVYEELRTSEEEVRVQQEQIMRLVSDQAADHRQQERMLAVLPVAVLTTDQHGVVRTANAAAAGLLRVPIGRLVGKPVFALISAEDRPELRGCLADGVHEPVRRVVTFLRRDRTPVAADVVLSPRPGPWSELRWVLLAVDDQGDESAELRHRVTSALMRLAASLGTTDDLNGLLARAAAIVRDGIDDHASVSIALGSPLDPTAIGTTPGLAQRADGAQVVAGDGPAVAAFRGDATVVSEDLRVDSRWPDLARRLPDGIGAAVAAPLDGDDRDVSGVLVVYLPPGRRVAAAARATGLFAVTLAALVAEFRAKAELAALAADLRRAMETRAVIEQAKGIIMAERRCDDEAAFAHLVRLSSTTHVKLREVARSVVARASQPPSAGG